MKKYILGFLSTLALFTIVAHAEEEKLPCESYQPGCTVQFFRHYKALKSGLDNFLKDNYHLADRLGPEIESVYHGAWLQRFENGVLVHLSAAVPFTPAPLPTHEGSTFILRFATEAPRTRSGEFFYHWSPQVTGIYDVDLFDSILKSYPHDNLPLGWKAALPEIPKEKLISLFRAHTEDSPINLSGGLAVIYGMYGLDRHLGLPTEQQFTRTVLRRNFANGYILAGMPSPALNMSKENEDQSADVDLVYVFQTRSEPKGSDDKGAYGGGKKFRAGSWSAMSFHPGIEEERNRPSHGLMRSK